MLRMTPRSEAGAMFERLSGEPIYNTSAVAKRTGVPADTFRAWERRYNLPQPGRTSGNQRLYAERDIATISWLREQTAAGMTISQAVALFRLNQQADADEVVNQGASASSNGVVFPLHKAPGPGSSVQLGAATNRLAAALLDVDGTTADRIVDEALAVGGVDGVCVDLLQPTLREVGDLWHRGETSVSVEHFASAFVERKLASLFNQSNPNHGRGPIIAACVAGERHALGLLTTAVLMSRHGFHIVYLGADLPLPDLLEMVDRLAPPMILLSASRDDTAETLRSWIPHLKAHRDDRPVPVVAFGGSVFIESPELRSQVDGVYLGHDARASIANTERLLANLPVVVE
jgi:DNA-binding transcriptional MerR regulator